MPAWSGLFNNTPDVNGGGASGHTLLGTGNALQRKLAKLYNRPGNAELKELSVTLNGTAAGSTATSTYKRVGHTVDPGNAVVNGGSRTIETVTVVNRATTSADVTDATNNVLQEQFVPTSYPVDKSGNGGGGKLAYAGIE